MPDQDAADAAPSSPSVSADSGDLVDRWMAAQLLLERAYFRSLGIVGGRRLRLLTLLELDVVTQLEDSGQSATSIAVSLEISANTARKVVDRLVRRGLVHRRRGGPDRWLVQRTAAADELITMLKRTQSDLVAHLLSHLDSRLTAELTDLMANGTLSLGGAKARAESTFED